MSPCKTAVTLVLFPLAFGVLVGLALSNSILTAIEDAQRERRERVTRVTEGYWKGHWNAPARGAPTVTTVASSAGEMEARYFVYDTAQNGPVIETVSTGTEPDYARN